MEPIDYSNSFWVYLLMAAIVAAGFIGGRFIRYLCGKILRNVPLYENRFKHTAIELTARTITFPLSVAAVCVALHALTLSPDYEAVRRNVISILIIIGITYVIYQLIELVDYWLRIFSRHQRTTLENMIVPLTRKTLRCITILLGAVQIAQQLSSKPITSIIAGLGVGGLAIALAAQDTIKNFFGSLVIFVDRPFQLGDLISASGQDGVVEEVGMRSTRIRTPDGHLVTIPNGELANTVIRNVSERKNIKQVSNIALTYDTPPAKVERAIAIIKEELNRKNEKLDPNCPPMVYFNSLNADSLNIQIVYWFVPVDGLLFNEFTQALNLALLRRFDEEGIDFAFPTRRFYLAGDPKRPLITPDNHYA